MILLLIIAGIANALMDYLQFHYYSLNQFWNPRLSWRNKYKCGEKKYGAKFPLSTTVLVFITDGWHLMQFICFSALFAWAVCFEPKYFFDWQALNLVANFIIYKSIFTGTKQMLFWYLRK
jgi:hypothetical protein